MLQNQEVSSVFEENNFYRWEKFSGNACGTGYHFYRERRWMGTSTNKIIRFRAYKTLEKPLHLQRAVGAVFVLTECVKCIILKPRLEFGNSKGEHYCNTIPEVLWLQLDGMDLNHMWLYQDDTSRRVNQLIWPIFPGHTCRNPTT